MEVQMADKYVDKVFIFSHQGIQIKTTSRFHLIMVRMVTIKKTNAGKDAGQEESCPLLVEPVEISIDTVQETEIRTAP
jgi:hypothetical protein